MVFGIRRSVFSILMLNLFCTAAAASTAVAVAPAPLDPCYDQYLSCRRAAFSGMFRCMNFEPTQPLVECATFSLTLTLDWNNPLEFDVDKYTVSIDDFWECLSLRGELSDRYIDLLDLDVTSSYRRDNSTTKLCVENTFVELGDCDSTYNKCKFPAEQNLSGTDPESGFAGIITHSPK